SRLALGSVGTPPPLLHAVPSPDRLPNRRLGSIRIRAAFSLGNPASSNSFLRLLLPPPRSRGLLGDLGALRWNCEEPFGTELHLRELRFTRPRLPRTSRGVDAWRPVVVY